MKEEIEEYLDYLRFTLEIEIDLHGSRSERVRDRRNLIIATEKELTEIKES
jgi:hypothetical protein